jgi:hypothetical protein
MTKAQRAKAAHDTMPHYKIHGAFRSKVAVEKELGEWALENFSTIREALEQMADEGAWRDIETAPYDTMALFYTVDGHVVQGFIYDGGAEDFGYTHWMPLPKPPLAAQESNSEGGGE